MTRQAEEKEEKARLECKTLKGKGEKLFSAHEIAPHQAMPLIAKLLRNSIPLPVRWTKERKQERTHAQTDDTPSLCLSSCSALCWPARCCTTLTHKPNMPLISQSVAIYCSFPAARLLSVSLCSLIIIVAGCLLRWPQPPPPPPEEGEEESGEGMEVAVPKEDDDETEDYQAPPPPPPQQPPQPHRGYQAPHQQRFMVQGRSQRSGPALCAPSPPSEHIPTPPCHCHQRSFVSV